MSQSEEILSWETPPELWRGFKPSASTWSGSVVSIFIAPDPSGAMVSVLEAHAFADRGLEGDRFFRESWSAANRPDKAVSLIEEEVLELAAKELGVASIADKTRRNIVIGGVLMRGIRLFEPCGHLEKVSKVPGIFKTLERRSGLKAAILSDGVIRVGDKISLQPAASMATA